MRIFFLLGLTLLFAFSACASLPPAEQRKIQFVETTTANKRANFSRSLAWIGKNFNDSNSAIKVKNEEDGQIIMKGNTICNELRQDPLGILTQRLSFNLDFQSKDSKIRFSFEDLLILDEDYKPLDGWMASQINSPEKLEKVKPCLAKIKDEVLRAINGTSDNW
jgi:hypothetical protein